MKHGNIKFSYEEVKDIFEEYNYKLITDNYINNAQKLTIKDNEGYMYVTTIRDFRSGYTPKKFFKSNPYTIQNIKLWLILNNSKLRLVSDKYESVRKNLIFKDDIGYYYLTSMFNVMLRPNPPITHISNLYTIHNIKLWCKLNNKQFELVSDTYTRITNKLKWKCLKEGCKEIFDMSLNCVYNGQNCPFCAGSQVGLSNCLATKRPDLISEWHPTKNGNLTPWDVTEFSQEYIWWRCKENPEHEWRTTVAHRHDRNCPECKLSKGEINIKAQFKFYNVFFIPQKTFDGLVGLKNGLLSYDFYLPQFNLLIEYQGRQHEKYIPGFHSSMQQFEKQQEHDRRKREYAKNNNIRLLEIWYWEFDKIEKIIHKEVIDKYAIKNYIKAGDRLIW